MEETYDPNEIVARVRALWAVHGRCRPGAPAVAPTCVDGRSAGQGCAERSFDVRRLIVHDVIARYRRMQGDGESRTIDAAKTRVSHPGVSTGDGEGGGADLEPLLDAFGADAVRLFGVSNSPPNRAQTWSQRGVEGGQRFLRKLWRLVYRHTLGGPARVLAEVTCDDEGRAMRRRTHEAIVRVSRDLRERQALNTAVAAIMALVNAVIDFEQTDEAGRAITQEALEAIVSMLSPIAPYLMQVLWESLGREGMLIDARWPMADAAVLLRDDLDLVVQVNGKFRGRISMPAGAGREQLEAAAMAQENAARFIDSGQVLKVIMVPGRLINVVVMQ